MVTVAGYDLPISLNDHTPLQAQASQLKRDFAEDLRVIRADNRYSTDGKRALIARAWLPYKQQMDTLRAREEITYARAKQDQRYKLVGLKNSNDPNAIISFRDAMDRAESLPATDGTEHSQKELSNAAENLLRRAQLSGDDILARAVLCVAIDRGISTIVDAYKTQHPLDADAIDSYYDLLKYDPEVSLQAYYLWRDVDKRPQELSAYTITDSDIATLASTVPGQASSNSIPAQEPTASAIAQWELAGAQRAATNRLNDNRPDGWAD